MIDLAHIDELARRLSGLGATRGLRESREELQQNFKSVLQTGLGKLDLVTRDEFDVQRAVLLRTREKLDELQRAIDRARSAARHVRPARSTEPPPWVLRSCTAVRAPACTRLRSGSRCTCPADCRAMSIVGLPEAAVREAKDRVRAAIQCAQFEFPARRHHRQPRAGRPAQGRRPLRPGDRARHPRRQRADSAATR